MSTVKTENNERTRRDQGKYPVSKSHERPKDDKMEIGTKFPPLDDNTINSQSSMSTSGSNGKDSTAEPTVEAGQLIPSPKRVTGGTYKI